MLIMQLKENVSPTDLLFYFLNFTTSGICKYRGHMGAAEHFKQHQYAVLTLWRKDVRTP